MHLFCDKFTPMCNKISLVNLVSMTYSCITLWRLSKGSSTADEQQPVHTDTIRHSCN